MVSLRGVIRLSAAFAVAITALGIAPASSAVRSLRVSNAAITEPTSTNRAMAFTVRLSSPATRTVTVGYKTVAGTAKGGSDFTAKSGTLKFAPGDTKELVRVPIKGDPTDEYTETFSLKLSSPLRATIADRTGVGTITDNDQPPFVSLPDATIVEGTAGDVPIVLNRRSAKPVTVFFQTADGNDTFADEHYTPVEEVVTIPAGALSTSVIITTPADDLDEPDQFFAISIRNQTNAQMGRDDGEVKIQDDDAPPSLTIDDVTLAEGDSGATNATFTITISTPSAQDVTGNFATVIGTASYEDFDYDAVTGGWTIVAGQTTTTINIPVNGDANVEADETFEVTLSAVPNATVSDATGLCTITNDDI